jgi:hypothetical protein
VPTALPGEAQKFSHPCPPWAMGISLPPNRLFRQFLGAESSDFGGEWQNSGSAGRLSWQFGQPLRSLLRRPAQPVRIA